jgi:hypothetical protein
MKNYVDEDGNIIETPETLIDRLELSAPKLHAKLEGLMAFKANLMFYRDFLYLPKYEDTTAEQWDQMIAAADAQVGLKRIINSLLCLMNRKRNITGDKVLVVQSDAPLYDGLIKTDASGGKFEAWIGEADSWEITDIKGSNLASLDGRIHQRFELKNASRVSNELLREYALGRMFYGMHHHDVDALDAATTKLQSQALGEKNITLYAPFPNMDHMVLQHVPKGNEVELLEIPYEQAEHIDLLPTYGARQIEGSQFTVFTYYDEKSPYSRPLLLGNDPSTIQEIYREAHACIAGDIERLLATDDVTSMHLWIAKRASANVTPDQTAKANDDYHNIRMMYKMIQDQGITISNQTMIGVTVWGDRKSIAEANEDMNAKLLEGLQSRGYYTLRTNIGYGWSKTCNGKLQERTDTFLNERARPFAGELIIFNS